MNPSPFDNVENIADFLNVWLSHDLLAKTSQAHLQDYYQRWSQMNSPRLAHWYKSQVKEIESYIAAAPAPRLLEVGVGFGTETLWFAQLGATVTGIDNSKLCLAVARERLDVLNSHARRSLNCQILDSSILNFEDSEGFDLIWLEQAFHHMEPRDEVIRQLASLLKPGGKIVFSEANALNPLLQAKLFRQRGFKTIIEVSNGNERFLWGNERILSASNLRRQLNRVGIESIVTRHYRIFPASKLCERLFPLERVMGYCQRFPLFKPLYTHYNFVGEKPRN